MSGFDLDGGGILKPTPVRYFLVHLDMLPTEEHPKLLRDYFMPMWTDLPLVDFIAGAERDYSCIIHWMVEVPPFKETRT